MERALRERRQALGLTQAELAAAASVSRPLVSAVEAGRHRPSVHAALALARALGTSVEDLFGAVEGRAVPVVPGPLREGTPVRVGRVRDLSVFAPVPEARTAPSLLGASDGWLAAEGVRLLPEADREGFVVAGCEPALALLARLLPGPGPRRLIPVHATSGRAVSALTDGRAHAALVHGLARDLRAARGVPHRFELARWRVGPPRHGRARGAGRRAGRPHH